MRYGKSTADYSIARKALIEISETKTNVTLCESRRNLLMVVSKAKKSIPPELVISEEINLPGDQVEYVKGLIAHWEQHDTPRASILAHLSAWAGLLEYNSTRVTHNE